MRTPLGLRLVLYLTSLYNLSQFLAKRSCGPLPPLRPSSFVAAVLLLVAGAAAAAPEATSDPLGRLVDEAIEANLSLEAQRLGERRAAAQVREAVGYYLPRVDLESRVSEMDGTTNLGDLVNPASAALNQLTGTNSFPTDLDLTFPQAHETRLRVSQPLLAEGVRANISLARARHDAQRLQLAAAARGIAAAVQIAYLEEASARRVVEIREAALSLARENERVAESLLAAGRVTPETVLRARADRAEVEQELDESREAHLARARELNRILRRPVDAPVEIVPDEAFDLPVPLDADAAVAHALGHREELAAGDAGIAAARSAKRAVTSRLLPNVSFAFDWGFQGSDIAFHDEDDYWMASLVAQWALLDLSRGAARSAAGLEVQRAKVARVDLEERIRLEVLTAHEAAVTARDAIATAEVRLEAARSTFSLVRRRYEEGVASPVELVDARTTYTSAELNRVLTAYRYAIRRVDLERAAALRDIDLQERSTP